MKSYIPPDALTLSTIAAQRCRLLILPMKEQPLPRPQGALTQNLGGLWIWTRDQSYRVSSPQSDKLGEAFPLGPPGSVVMIKEALIKNEQGLWCRAANGMPITLPHDDSRILEMTTWAHHNELSACSAQCMPSWAARCYLKIGKVYAKRIVELTQEEAVSAGHPLGLQSLLLWLRGMLGEATFKGSLWVWLAAVENCDGAAQG